jgi:hypothetical protein
MENYSLEAGFASHRVLYLTPSVNGSVDPGFERREDSLVLVAKSTCFIAVKPGRNDGGTSTPFASGTAFFVGPTTLVTAGHLAPDGKRDIVAQFPGIKKSTLFVEDYFDNPVQHNLQTFQCKFVGSGLPNADISILEVRGSYRAETYLKVRYLSLTSEDQQSVDVIGYTGSYNERYVRTMNRKAHDEDVDDLEALFPRRQLIISHGPVVVGGIMPKYRVSTVIGMSGSAVVVNGAVIGNTIILELRTDIYFLGGHIGSNTVATNRCIAFCWVEVWTLLEKHGVVGEVMRTNYNSSLIYSSGTELRKSESKVGLLQRLKGMSGKEELATEAAKRKRKTLSNTQDRHEDDRMSQSTIW